MNGIKFGTDGWRGIIAKDFTFKNVMTVAQAIAGYYETVNSVKKDIYIGYDLRFASEKYAGIIAEVISGNGFNALLSKKAVTSPVISFSALNKKALCGIMVTASHNPPEYNGIKIKTSDGASATEKETKAIESLLYKSEIRRSGSNIRTVDLETDYFKKLKTFIDLKSINKSRFTAVIEPMWGSSQGYLLNILSKSKLKLFPIHHYRDALFGGLRPEPLEQNLADLKKEIKRVKADIGLVTDGDGDRVALIDDLGRFFSSQHIIPLIAVHLLKNKKWTGGVVTTTSTTSALEIIAKDYGLKIYRTPIGFKNVANLMINEDILIGGEESGGVGVKNYMPERDGVLTGLLILEMMAQTGKTVRALLNEIEKKYGKFCYDRIDMEFDPSKREKIMELLKTYSPEKLAGNTITEIIRTDGTKFIMKDLSWLVIRTSGTEPIIRIYSESNSAKRVKEFLNFGVNLIKNI